MTREYKKHYEPIRKKRRTAAEVDETDLEGPLLAN
jgi:hypothetical protein